MAEFEFSNNVVDKVIEEIDLAKKFIYIAVFQLHRQEIFKILNKKLDEGLEVEIFTLPYDSIHTDDSDPITNNFKKLEKKGAILNFCCWNVGNPSRTTTAVGQWYSFHGKFIVTDKSAIAMSANFTIKDELDALLIFRNKKDKIDEFTTQFKKLKTLFIDEKDGFNGEIRKKIISTKIENIEDVFDLPSHIDSNRYKNHWVKDYPTQIFTTTPKIEEKLYLIPFEGKGRDLFERILLEAKKYIYLSTETFTDLEFPTLLKKLALRGLEIKIFSSTETMDFKDRVQKMFRELLSLDIEINTTDEDLHAKLIITDKSLALSSINLNKISLGFRRKIGFWRENTEVMYVCRNEDLINKASNKFKEVFDSGKSVKFKLSESLGEDLAKKVRDIFGIYSVNSDAKELFGSIFLDKEIEIKSTFIKLGSKISDIMTKFNKSQVQKDHFEMGYILYLIDEKINTFKKLNKRLTQLGWNIDLKDNLKNLINKAIVVKTQEFYKISDFWK